MFSKALPLKEVNHVEAFNKKKGKRILTTTTTTTTTTTGKKKKKPQAKQTNKIRNKTKTKKTASYL